MKIAIWWQQESWGGVDTHLATLLGSWPEPDEFTIFHNTGNSGFARIAAAIAGRRVRSVTFPDWQHGDASLVVRAVHHVMLPLRFLSAVLSAQRLLSAHGPFDAFIADNGAYPGAWTCLAALAASHRIGIAKRMLLVHHAASTYGLGRRFFEQFIDRGVQAWATDLVAVSRATRDTLIRLRFFNTERNPVRVVHNGIRMSGDVAQDPDMRRSWGIGPQDFVVGMIGRVQRYKGHEDTLLAMAELTRELRDRLHLVVVGSGTESEITRLRRIAERLGLADRLHFTGYLSNDPVVLARQFDVLAMVTKDFEGFGLAVAEAMVAGTPVLASAVGGITEFVTPETAMLVPPESPEEIARALAAIMADPAAAAIRVQNAKVQIANYSGEIMSRRFHRLLSL
jgi:glycosyltransferase involved in cell wall biosynthesis